MKDTGGPAFPSEQGSTPEGTWNQTYNPGMTLRDAFAIAALTGLMSNTELSEAMMKETSGDLNDAPRVMAVASYSFADAMLAERSKP
jgi:hypothetical protein